MAIVAAMSGACLIVKCMGDCVPGCGSSGVMARAWAVLGLDMAKDHQKPACVGKYPTEFQASLVRNMLVEAGIPSQVAGGITAGFRAETPGIVQVLVPGPFEEEARLLIEEFQEEVGSDGGTGDGE
jgi:hypothetical protein